MEWPETDTINLYQFGRDRERERFLNSNNETNYETLSHDGTCQHNLNDLFDGWSCQIPIGRLAKKTPETNYAKIEESALKSARNLCQFLLNRSRKCCFIESLPLS